MKPSSETNAIERKALEFARKNKTTIAKCLTNKDNFPSEPDPVSVFMAGSPGAGKTEASKELLREISGGRSVIRIDPDELRENFGDYDGTNSWMFHRAVSVLVAKMLDLVFKQSQSFLLDGTFANYELARQNVERSLKRKRFVQILYVYQDPYLAWGFVMDREATEGRRVPPESFVEQYFGARQTVNRLKSSFGERIRVDLLLKNTDGSNRFYKSGVDQIDYHIPENFDRNQVMTLVGLEP